MKEFRYNKATKELVDEINELLLDLRDYLPTHVCKLGVNPFDIKDLEKIYNRACDKNGLEKNFTISKNLEALWSELNENKDSLNLLIVSGIIYYRGTRLNDYGVLTSDIMLKVSKEILVEYNDIFKDTDFMDTFKKYKSAANKLLEKEEAQFVLFMLEVIKETLVNFKENH